MDTFRDTFVGQAIRLATGKRVLKYPDEVNPESFRRCVTSAATLTRSQTNSEWTNTRNPNVITMNSQQAAEPFLRRRTTSARSVPTTAQTHAPQTPTTPASVEEEKTEQPVRSSDSSSSSSDTESEDTIAVNNNNNHIDMSKIETQKSKADTNIVVFLDGDKENPQNWSLLKKFWVTGQVCFLTFSIYIGSAIYTAGTEDIVHQFHISSTVAVLGLTVFVLGYGVGPMFLAWIAEAPPVGRTPLYIFSVVAFTLFNLGVLWAKNLGMLLAFRFITGFVGSPVLATGGASLADMWSERKRMYAIGIWGVFAVCGPVLGPLIGGFAAEFKGWKWPILELIWLNAFCSVLLAFCLPETSAATILYHRAKRLRKALNDPTLETEADIESKAFSKSDLLKFALVLPFTLSFREPILFFTNLYLGLVYAILYCWFEAFPLTFMGVYGMSLGVSGLAYIGILVGSIVCIIGYFIYLRVHTEKAMIQNRMTPEKRLPAAIVGSIFLPVCMFWFGWTAKASVHWISPIIASSFFAIGALLLFNAVLNYQADAYPK